MYQVVEAAVPQEAETVGNLGILLEGNKLEMDKMVKLTSCPVTQTLS